MLLLSSALIDVARIVLVVLQSDRMKIDVFVDQMMY